MIGKYKIDPVKLSVSVLMVILSLAMLIPLAWMLSASFKVEADVFEYPIRWIPKTWNAVNNYRTVVIENNFLGNYWNSMVQTGGTVLLSMVVGSLAAYGFIRVHFAGRDKLFLFLLTMMMIPPQLTLIPRFMIITKIGLYDTLLSLILMEGFSVYGVFLLRQFMMGIPDSICEAATIDGAGHFTVFARIVFPMLQPALATLAILKTVWTWNDYQGPLVFLRSSDKFTVQLAVQQFALADGLTPIYSLVMTGAVIATVPLIVVFIIFQAQVIEGVAVGAVKG